MTSNTKTLEGRGYVATERDVAQLAKSILKSEGLSESGRASYLRVLIATTQNELRDEDDPLNALYHVNKRFYAVVTRIADNSLPREIGERAVELNRITNYARTAAYSIRTWMKAGNDIKSLDARVTTKALLAVPRSSSPDSAFLRARVERTLQSLQAHMDALAASSPETAVEEMRQMVAAFSEKLATLESESAVPEVAAPAQKKKATKAA